MRLEAGRCKFASEFVLGDDVIEPGEAAAVGALVVVACTGIAGVRVCEDVYIVST